MTDKLSPIAEELQGERKGLMLCCMRTAERYGDSTRGKIEAGTTITCDKCGQEVESTGGQAWKAK